MTTLPTLCIVEKPDYIYRGMYISVMTVGKKSISQIPATALFLALAKHEFDLQMIFNAKHILKGW